MFPIFNSDMGRRIADLHQAVEEGREIHCHFEPAAKIGDREMPARIVVSFEPERKFSLPTDIADAVSDQFEVNGRPVFASRLRPPVAGA